MTEDQILSGILAAEGGYSDRPQDRGGCTNMGITKPTLGAWRGAEVTCADIQTLTVDEAKAIYRAKYIAPLADLDDEIRVHAIDVAVTSGLANARMLVDRAYQYKGRRTWAQQLVVERIKFFARIVESKPTQSVFLLGWLNRALRFF